MRWISLKSSARFMRTEQARQAGQRCLLGSWKSCCICSLRLTVPMRLRSTPGWETRIGSSSLPRSTAECDAAWPVCSLQAVPQGEVVAAAKFEDIRIPRSGQKRGISRTLHALGVTRGALRYQPQHPAAAHEEADSSYLHRLGNQRR